MVTIMCEHVALEGREDLDTRILFQAASMMWKHPDSTLGLWSLRATLQKKPQPRGPALPLADKYRFLPVISLDYARERRQRPQRPARPKRGANGHMLPEQLPDPSSDRIALALSPHVDPLTATLVAPLVAEQLEKVIFALDDAMAKFQENWNAEAFSATVEHLALSTSFDLDGMVEG